MAAIATFYGPVRFVLDYLRIDKVRGADPRYFGLTPAQYAAIAVIAIGIALIVRVSKIAPRAIRADGTMPSADAPKFSRRRTEGGKHRVHRGGRVRAIVRAIVRASDRREARVGRLVRAVSEATLWSPPSLPSMAIGCGQRPTCSACAPTVR